MTFEIVNHCHQYARLLNYQLSSLVLHPPTSGIRLIYTLFADPDDRQTVETFNAIAPMVTGACSARMIPMEVGLLRNRAVGRNRAAKTSKADWIWFTDTDYVFLASMWKELAGQLKDSDANMVWPSTIYESSWEVGDGLIEAVKKPGLLDFCRGNAAEELGKMFDPKRMFKAIGGIQFVRGEFARKNGYCPLLTGPSPTWNFRSDILFRRSVWNMKSLDFGPVIRIRHSRRGYGAEADGVVN